jgi:hypothetical protein
VQAAKKFLKNVLILSHAFLIAETILLAHSLNLLATFFAQSPTFLAAFFTQFFAFWNHALLRFLLAARLAFLFFLRSWRLFLRFARRALRLARLHFALHHCTSTDASATVSSIGIRGAFLRASSTLSFELTERPASLRSLARTCRDAAGNL